MYDVKHALYPLKLTEFVKKVPGLFILNGAFCTISTGGVTPGTGLVIQSQGFHYTNTPGNSTPSVSTLTDENIVIDFIFYKKYETKLVEDVHGKITWDNNQYLLHIKNEVTILDFCPHNDLKLRLTKAKPLTVEDLREILGQVRAMYLLSAMDTLHDVLPVPSTKEDRDPILTKIREYLKYATDKGFIFDLCVKSTTDIEDKKLLQLSLRKKDGSKASKDVAVIELFARKYEPAIIFNTYFENDKDPFKGVFIFLDANVEPYVISKNINMEEADYFIKGIQRIASELVRYTYVTDVTP